MIVNVNLSSEPFRRDRPILVASSFVGLLLAGLLAMLISLATIERGHAADTHAAISEIEKQLQTMTAEQAQLEATLERPENAEVLDLVAFVNTLLYRKGISWTKIFSDLADVVPHDVRLISVRPQVNARNEILLDMVVGSQSQAPVVEMLKRMESSPMFGNTAVHNWLPPAQTEPLYRYRVSVNYAQKL